MRKYVLIIVIIPIIIISCQKSEYKYLNQTIDSLTMENMNLKDSISKLEDNSILNSTLIGLPDRIEFQVNDTGTVRFGFLKYGEIGNYDVYQKMNDTGERKLLFSNLTNATFDYKFCPKSIEDNEIEMITVFKINGLPNEVYTILEFPIKE